MRRHVRVLPEHGSSIPAVLNRSIEAAAEHRGLHESVVSIILPCRLANDELVERDAGVLVDLEQTGEREVVAGVPDELVARVVVLLVIELRFVERLRSV